MKKVVTILLILIFSLSVLCFPACHKREKEETNLPSLTASIKGDTISWEAFGGADHYSVKATMKDGISGYRIKVSGTSYVIPHKTAGDYLFTILAVNASGKSIASSTFSYHIGKGSSDDPIEISTADALLSITGSNEYKMERATIRTPIYYRLTSDIDLTGKEVTPIGNSSNHFRGVFDGNGHKITGLSFTKSNSDGIVGLFGVIDNAVVKNLTIEEGSIRFDRNSGVSGNALCYGLLVGSAISSFVDNCHVTGKVDILSDITTTGKYTLSAGGIVGRFNSGEITSSSFRGEVTSQYSQVYVGGLVGEAKGSSPTFTMVNCFADATVKGTATGYNVQSGVSNATARVGVLVGTATTVSRFASLVATGSATALTTRDGTDKSDITDGVFGNTPYNAKKASTAPIFNLFYLDTITKVAGTTSSLGSYESNVHPLSESELKQKASFLVTKDEETSYGLDFDTYWSITEGEYPALRGANGTTTPRPLELTISYDSEESSLSFALENTILPTIHPLLLDKKTEQFLGYKLRDLLSKLGIDPQTGSKITLTAEGMDPIEVEIINGKPDLYLVYAENTPLEGTPTLYSSYKIINSTALTTQELTGVTKLTITVNSPSDEEEK